MIEFMKRIAEQAGAIAFADLLSLKASSIHRKGTCFDLVTDTDRKVEDFIIGQIRAEHPECGVFGEETGKSGQDKEFCFVIDPIDGTASFAHHLPNWCISIGLHRCGVPVAGVVFQPVSGDLYYAEQGKGAFMNGHRLRVSSRSVLSESIVSTGFSCLRAQWSEENNLPFFCRIAPRVQDIRKYGSAALDCCLIARGSLDAYWELFLQPYDIGAGVLILTEAGGHVTDLFGGDGFPGKGFLGSNGLIHKEILTFFHDYRNLCR